MDLVEIANVVSRCSFPGYTFRIAADGRGAWYLQAHYDEPDSLTGAPSVQYTRRWFLSPQMAEGEIVQTVFKCVLTSAEHRTREFFRYMGRAVFGPHLNIERLWEIAEDTEERR